jgi:hypothetical protein
MECGKEPAQNDTEKEEKEGQYGKPGRFMSSPTDGKPLMQ